MEKRETRDFLIRNMPIEVYHLLEQSAKEHQRSKNQEAVLAITNYLTLYSHQIKKPKPFKWKNKISNEFIENAIDEGRE